MANVSRGVKFLMISFHVFFAPTLLVWLHNLFDESRNCFCALKCPSLISLKDDFWLQNFNNLDQLKRGSAVVVHFCRLQCSLPHYKPPLNRILLQCLRSPSLSLLLPLPLSPQFF